MLHFNLSHLSNIVIILVSKLQLCTHNVIILVFRQQRVLTYQVLCSWLVVAGSQSSIAMFSESLTSGILSDIKYDKPSINLIVSLISSIKYGWS